MAYSSNPDMQRFVDRLTSRSILTEDEQQAILCLPGRPEHVQSNRDFVPLGMKVDHVSLILDGIVGRFDQNWEGKRQITALHVSGDMADLVSVVQPTSSSALQALSIATILKIPHSAIRAATVRYPAVAEALWRDTAVDGAILAQWVVNVGRRDARQRVAHLLCEMATRLGAARSAGETFFPFAVTQTQLADATGLTAVHINRTLQGMRRDKLAEVTTRAVRIPDWSALVSAGEFDAAYLQANIKRENRLRMVQPF